MLAYKLLHKRKDGSIGPLFINKRQRIPLWTWLPAKNIPTKGFARRPGWHSCPFPKAPHLHKRNSLLSTSVCAMRSSE